MKNFITCAVTAFVVSTSGAIAQSANTYGHEGNWSLFKDGTGSKKACWIVTQRSTKATVKMLFMVTKIGRQDYGVTLVARSAYPKETPIFLEIPGLRSFEFTRRGRDAWPKHASDDPKIIKALAEADASSKPVTFSFGNKVLLDYDVAGFQKALNRLKETCVS